MATSNASKAKILMVEDNKDILEEAAEYLARHGYGVLAASNGADALVVLEANPDLDLLFTDVILPGGFSGRALFNRAVQLRPEIKVLLTSGYHDGQGNPEDLVDGAKFLAKPYRMRELALKIEEVLKTGA